MMMLTLGAIAGIGFAYIFLLFGPIDVLTQHDEPIIVEEGSMKIDFNPKKWLDLNPLTSVGEKEFVRPASLPMKYAKIWQLNDGQVTEILCGPKKNEICQITGKSILIKTIGQDKDERTQEFVWSDLSIFGVSFRAHEYNGVENRFKFQFGRSMKISSRNDKVKIKYVSFQQQGGSTKEISFRSDYNDTSVDDVFLAFCAVDSATHCYANPKF